MITTKPSINIFVNGEITISHRHTGFFVKQEKDGTKVYVLVGGKRRYLKLPHTQYSLASDSPACGHGYAQFEKDFLSIIHPLNRLLEDGSRLEMLPSDWSYIAEDGEGAEMIVLVLIN